MLLSTSLILITGFAVCLSIDSFTRGDLHGFYGYSLPAGISAALFLRVTALTNAPIVLMVLMGAIAGYLGARIFFDHHCAISSEISADASDTSSSSSSSLCPE